MLAAREPSYREAAALSVAVDGKTIDELVEEIADRVPEYFAEERSGRRSRWGAARWRRASFINFAY